MTSVKPLENVFWKPPKAGMGAPGASTLTT